MTQKEAKIAAAIDYAELPKWINTPLSLAEEVDWEKVLVTFYIEWQVATSMAELYSIMSRTVAALTSRDSRLRQATIKEVVERVRKEAVGKDEDEKRFFNMRRNTPAVYRNGLRRKQRAALKKIEEEM